MHGNAALIAFVILSAVIPARGAQIKESISTSELQWRFRGNKVLTYAFGTNQFKPYVRELYTLKGDNVLRDAPSDHLHHHGLMYAIRVNGVNFWEENDKPGYEKSMALVSNRAGKTDTGLPKASFTQSIHWVAETNKHVADSKGVALLMEERTLTLVIDEKAGEVALRWDAEFTVGNTAATLAGTKYNGLGFRLPESFDRIPPVKRRRMDSRCEPDGAACPARSMMARRWWRCSAALPTAAETLASFQ